MFRTIFDLFNMTKEMADDTISSFTPKTYIKSISSYSSNSIFYFPLIVSDSCSPDEVSMMSKHLEAQYAAFVAACISLIPFHRIPNGSQQSIEEYLRQFHQNIGTSAPLSANDIAGIMNPMGESVVTSADEKKAEQMVTKFYNESLGKSTTVIDRCISHIRSIQEMGTKLPEEDVLTRVLKKRMAHQAKLLSEAKQVGMEFSNDEVSDVTSKLEKTIINQGNRDRENEREERITSKVAEKLSKKVAPMINNAGRDTKGTSSKDQRFSTYDKGALFKDVDIKKANQDLPTFITPEITFIVGKEEATIKHQVLVGIKCYVHTYSAMNLVEDLYQSINSNRKFLKFVKFITGEERSLSELLFGMSKIKYDLKAVSGMKNRPSSGLLNMIKTRSRWSKMGIPYLTKTYTPNASFIITKNDTQILKNQYGIDIFTNGSIPKVMKDNFLLGFVVLDQQEEVAYVYYEGNNYQYQEIGYNTLERESKESERATKQLYRDMYLRR